MFCPKCGVENPEGANLCRNCGQVLTNVVPVTIVSNAKTSALAITSMILGILSFCTCLLTSPLAIIFGIISLIMIVKSNGRLKGIGFAITGIVVPVVALPIVAIMMGITMPALARARMVAQRMVCGKDMAVISKDMILYAENNKNMYPASDKWCDLLIQYDPNLTKKMFRCPSDKEGPCSYAMNKNIEKLGVNSPPDMVLLFESKPGWNQSGGLELLTTENHQGEGCNIAFNDGFVKFIQSEDIKNLKWTAGP
jgi:hypothetical protein